MDAVWIAAAAIALVGWAAFRFQFSREKRGDEGPPPAKSISPLPARVIPSFAEHDDDEEIDVTVVTASPFQATAGHDSELLSENTGPHYPVVNVMYEEEAEAEEVTSPSARILISAEAQSHRGRVRERNEDSVLSAPAYALYVVADGMGGYRGGEVASSIAVETLRTAYETSSFEGSVSSPSPLPRRGREIACAIQMANQAIMASAARDSTLAEMGTTIIAARFSPNKQRVYIGHVGDCRCYRLRGRLLRQLTTDHTLRELGLKGPTAKQLFQAVGHKSQITIDLVVDRPQPEDIYLLCSDGLPKMVPDAKVRELLLSEPSLPTAVERLVSLANLAGGKDNVSVVLVRVEQLGSRVA